MTEYTFQAGDSLHRLAMENGLVWETIWEHPDNADLKDLRKHPSALIEGDVVRIPDVRPKEAAAATEKLHRFRRKGAPPPSIQYKIEVEYGDFEALLDPPDTIRGRQQRLQGIGFYHGPIDGDEGALTRRCWRHFREEIDHAAGRTLGDDEAIEELKTRYRAVLRPDGDDATAQEDFAAAARLVVPGTFCYTADDQLGDPLSRHRYSAERRFFEANPALNRVPIVARVKVAETDQPAPGVRVAFELIKPYDAPDDQKEYLSRISAASERTRSPRAFVRSRLPSAASDPYGFNCPESRGGKTPADAAGTILATEAVDGFPWTPGTDARPNPFSVTCLTDAEGRTGVLFRPSRQGGDAYRIQASVVVEGRERTADESKKGGVITIWRNLRLARIVQKAAHGAWAGSPPVGAGMTGPLGTIQPSVIRTEVAKAFLILEADRRVGSPLVMNAAGYREAMEFAVRGAANPQNFDLATLVRTDMASPFLFWLERDTTYNANRAAGTTALNLAVAATWTQIKDLTKSLRERFLQYWGGGTLPGMVIVRSEIGDSYSYWNHPNKPAGWTATTSGVATRFRGCYVWYPLSVYQNSMPYGLTQNTMHEAGHTLYLRHHHTAGAAGTESGGFPRNHDRNDWCLMGYLALTTHDYCGKCLLKLRGWDETHV